MNLSQLKDYVQKLTSHVLFEYNGTNCGIDPLARDHFDMWYGEKYYKAESIDDVMNYPLFDGRSLTEIFEEITALEY